MELIEISPDFYLTPHSIMSLKVSAYDVTTQADIGYGRRGRPRKIGEKINLRIQTLDGKLHMVNEEYVDDVYKYFFGDMG